MTPPLRAALLICILASPLLCAPAVRADEPAQPASPAESRWNDAASRLVAREAQLGRPAACSDPLYAKAKLSLEKALILLRAYYPSEFRDNLVTQNVAQVESYLADPNSMAPLPIQGFHELAYVSDVDLSPQPYLLYVPTTYDGQAPIPLVVFLHGYAGDLNKVNWIEYMYSPSLQKVCEELGYALLLPYGRSNTEFMGIGESDVLHAIDLVKHQVRIDDDRVVISGASMGGSGAYTIACHHPQDFSGIFTVTGRIDYYLWMGRPKDAFPRYKQVQIDTDYARDLLGNLLYVPVFIGHSPTDPLVRIEQSRLMVKLLQERGQQGQLIEFGNGGHYIWSDTFEHPQLRADLQQWRRPPSPAKVQYRTYTLKYPTAYWVTIDGMEAWGEPADVTAEVQPDLIAVNAKNVTSLTLRGAPVVKATPVFVNGQSLGEYDPAKGSATFVVKQVDLPGALRKTPTLCGPVREAYDAPFIIVTPGVDNAESRQDKVMAQQVAREWSAFAQGPALVKKDAEVSKEDIAGFNLILCGAPETNSLLALVAPQLPIRITPDAYVVGDRSLPRKGNGLMMIYPNPLNPKRYILIREGVLWGASLSVNHKLDLVPDFIIYTPQLDNDNTMFPTNQTLCAGYFDPAWQLSDKSTWTAGQ